MASPKTALPGLQLEVIETDPAVVYALDSKLRITYCNLAWDRFAAENGGERCVRDLVTGRCIADFIAEPLLPFYMDAYARIMSTGVAWEHIYDCSGAQMQREFHMRVLPLANGGLLVINSKVRERPRPAPAPHLPLEAYVRPDGFLRMCCHCRRTQRVDDNAVWDWVPEHVANLPRNVSHGICGLCEDYHYGESGDGWK